MNQSFFFASPPSSAVDGNPLPPLFDTIEYLNEKFSFPAFPANLMGQQTSIRSRGVSEGNTEGGRLNSFYMEMPTTGKEDEEIELLERESTSSLLDSHLPRPRTPRPKLKDEKKSIKPPKAKWRRCGQLQKEDADIPLDYAGEMVDEFFLLPAPMIDDFLAKEDDPNDSIANVGGPTWRFCQAVKDYKRKREEHAAPWFDEDPFVQDFTDLKNKIKDREHAGDLIPLWMSIRMEALRNLSAAHRTYRLSKQLERAYERQKEQNHWDGEYVDTLENEMTEMESHHDAYVKREKAEILKTIENQQREILKLQKLSLLQEEFGEEAEELTQKLPEYATIHDVPVGSSIYEDGSIYGRNENGDIALIGVLDMGKNGSNENPLKIRRLLCWKDDVKPE